MAKQGHVMRRMHKGFENGVSVNRRSMFGYGIGRNGILIKPRET
jgi:hypothetical protein